VTLYFYALGVAISQAYDATDEDHAWVWLRRLQEQGVDSLLTVKANQPEHPAPTDLQPL
jgi:hypothetical protein